MPILCSFEHIAVPSEDDCNETVSSLKVGDMPYTFILLSVIMLRSARKF